MQYSISDLEQLSGVSTHNIRIWERRYNALQPSRTAGNTRFYHDDQLKRLLNIAGLYHAGFKISVACAMDKAAIETFLQREISQTISAEKRYEYSIAQIIRFGMEYNETQVNALIERSFNQNGILETYKFVFYPLLVRLGWMWRQESLCPSQEHFLSAILRQKLFSAINSCPPGENSLDGGWLLFLPEDEDHDIGLLLASYLLRHYRNRVIYLGPKVPEIALSNTIDATSPQKLLFFMTRVRPVAEAQGYVDRLSQQFPAPTIYVSGNQKLLGALQLPANVKWLRGIDDFESIINPSY